MMKTAKFNVGDIVQHTKFGYRAIIVDVDPLFTASGKYNPQACKHEFATKNPWYRLLLDHCAQETYVEECFLIQDRQTASVDNPNVDHYLKSQKGQYSILKPIH